MNLLADECVAAEVVSRLRADGHTVEAAGDAARGAPDDDVLARAAAAGQVLVTADKDFGELVYRLRRVHAGVVLLRLAGMSAADRVETVSAVFRDRAAERVFLLTPFMGPFRWSRLFWTYIVPLLPLVLLFDVVVSLLGIYSEPELRDLTAGLDDYQWNIGKVRGRWMPVSIPYLIGVPVEKGSEPAATAEAIRVTTF